jgi:MFS family permease
VSTWATVKQLRSNQPLAILLIVNVIVTIAAMSMNVTLTSIVTLSFEGDAGALGAAHALNAVGAIAGGLILARFRVVHIATLVPACLAFATVLLVNAAAPSLVYFLIAAPLLGLGLGFYSGVLNSAAQNAAPAHTIGRIMSLVTLGNVGVAPIGALIAGVVTDAFSGQMSLAFGAVACLFCSILVYVTVVRPQRGLGRSTA